MQRLLQIIAVSSLLSFSVNALEKIDFDKSMQASSFNHIRVSMLQYYQTFKNIYEKNFQTQMKDEDSSIPKIVHQIWLGGKLPEEYRGYRESWLAYHPKWYFVYWTDSPLNYDQGSLILKSFAELQAYLECPGIHQCIVMDTRALEFDNKIFYDRAVNYGEKSDILKWEIIYRFGGVYVDTDYQALKPLDDLHRLYDFYTGLQPLDTNMVQLGAALYGAIPYHPLLKMCVEKIKENQHIQQIVLKTGPIHFTKCFLAMVEADGSKDIALPASYLYPCAYEQRGQSKETWEKPESIAIHHWAGSWLKPEAFERKG